MTRRAWMLAAALMTAGVLGVATLLSGSPEQHPGRARGQAAWVAPVALSPTTPALAERRPAPRKRDHKPPVGGVRPAPAEASRVTRAFLGAYVRYELGHADAATMRTLRDLATPAFWRTLARPPRPAGTSGRARVTSIAEGATTGTHNAATVVATLRRATETSGLAVVLTNRAGGWRVAGITR
ncbi:MAG: hypothetical protein AB7H92_16680 [Microbacteriaceae bacterium]